MMGWWDGEWWDDGMIVIQVVLEGNCTHQTIFLKFSAVPVVPGQAGGGSFQKEKNYIAQKEFAYRMCAW